MALDFYDGAVGGFVELVDDTGICRWFRFELFAWDNDRGNRVFGLAAAENVRDVLDKADDAQWPFWFPQTPSSVTESLEQVRNESNQFAALILSDGYFKTVTRSSVSTPELKVPNELPNYDTENFGFWQSRLLSSD